MKKYSLLGFALITASSITAFISQSKATAIENKLPTGKLVISTTGGALSINVTCINDDYAEHCDYTLTGDAGAFSGSTRLAKGTGTAAVGLLTEFISGTNPGNGTTVY